MLLALALLSAIAPLAIDMYLPGLPALGDDLGTSTQSVQLTLTTFMAGLGIGHLVVGPVARVVAPLLGGALLDPVGWRGIFWVLTGAGVVMVVGILTLIPETLPPERRHGGGLAALAHNMRYVLGNRRYVGYALTFM